MSFYCKYCGVQSMNEPFGFETCDKCWEKENHTHGFDTPSFYQGGSDPEEPTNSGFTKGHWYCKVCDADVTDKQLELKTTKTEALDPEECPECGSWNGHSSSCVKVE